MTAYIIRLLASMLVLWAVRQGVVFLRRRLTRVSGPTAVQSPWDIMGLQPGATPETVEETWRRLIQENHPDRVSHMDPEIQALAARRTQAINEAYATLKGRTTPPR